MRRDSESKAVLTGVRPPRRYDIDWLRITAVLLLIPYHTSRVFNAGEDFYSKNRPVSTAINRFVGFLGPWHMSLLFFLAGASSWFALGFRSGGRYAGERARRLLVPFVFGLVVLIPPQSYMGMLTNSQRHLSFFGQYKYYWTHAAEGLTGYDGTWTPGHLWFILFLVLFSLLALPLFLWLRRGSARGLIDRFAAACRFPGVVILPALVLALLKDVDFLEVSGQNLICFFLLFVFGFLMVADERITAAIGRQWPALLTLGVAAMAVRVYLHPWDADGAHASWLLSFWERWVYEFAVWLMILGLLGLFHRYANRTNRAYAYATESAYPFYVLHQTVLVLIAYEVVRWGVGASLKYTVIALATLAATLLVYEVAVRRWSPVRLLFGMKPRRARPQPGPAAPAAEPAVLPVDPAASSPD